MIVKKKKKKEKEKKKKKRKEKRTCKIVDFAVPVDDGVKLKESKERDRYQDIARELKKLWNMKVTMLPVVIGELNKSSKDWYRDWRT